MRCIRFPSNPLIFPALHSSIGTNINGPSLIRVPEWLPNPLGRYYLYFGHHHGEHIRLAVADRLEGPWRVHAPGVLRVEQTICSDHVASPDVHIDEQRRQIVMYFHGPVAGSTAGHPVAAGQLSFAAVSSDGLNFTAGSEPLGAPYFRVFAWHGQTYALGMPGVIYRSADGLSGFVEGPTLFSRAMRHSAVLLCGSILHVFYSNAGDCPERILHSTVDLTPDWLSWQAYAPETLLQPEKEYEGANLPLKASVRGWAPDPVRELRDPAVFTEAGRSYLLYSVAGEAGIAAAEIVV